MDTRSPHRPTESKSSSKSAEVSEQRADSMTVLPTATSASNSKPRDLWKYVAVAASAVPGGIWLGSIGGVIAAFSGDASPARTALYSWLTWGVCGGACIGALPGLLLGLLFKFKWVRPFLGGAAGACYGLFEAAGIHLTYNTWRLIGGTPDVRAINLGGYASGFAVVLGLLLGSFSVGNFRISMRNLLLTITLVALLLGLLAFLEG